jgi:hypothetical protein
MAGFNRLFTLESEAMRTSAQHSFAVPGCDRTGRRPADAAAKSSHHKRRRSPIMTTMVMDVLPCGRAFTYILDADGLLSRSTANALRNQPPKRSKETGVSVLRRIAWITTWSCSRHSITMVRLTRLALATSHYAILNDMPGGQVPV